MRRHAPALLLPLLLLFLALPAAASDWGLYASYKAGTTDVDSSFGDNFDTVVLDGDDNTNAIEVGFRFKWFGIQAGYHDLGEVEGFQVCEECADNVLPTTAETEAFSLSFVPELPLGRRLSVFGKVGIVAWETDLDEIDLGQSIEDPSDEELIYGAGLRLDFLGPTEIFAEFERIGSDIETVSFGVTLLF